MVFNIIFVISCITTSITGHPPAPTETFPHYAILDSRNENVLLYWKFDDTYIIFEMIGNTSGWVGFGISPNGGMQGADIYVGWVKDGNAYITDRHGLHNGYPPKTEEQDVTLLDGSEENGWTRIKFQRSIAACEVDYDITITANTLRTIWALGQTDPQDDDITVADFHALNRGSRSLLVLESNGAKNIQLEENLEEYSFLNNKIQIPPQDTFYSCTMFKFPELNGKRHVVSMEPIIQEGHELFIHHFIVYQCSRDPTDPSVLGETHECKEENMPADFLTCSFFIFGWAIGGGTFYYPEHVGFPIGTAVGPRYVMLQIHYDNPNLRPDIVDSSGVKIFYTDQLRENDGGIIQVGHTVHPYTQLIPPNANSYLTYGECTSNCLAGGMNYAGVSSINVFGTQLHSHLLGRALTLRHLANNTTTELPYLTQDSTYDFNYQETKFFPKEITIKPGDSLQLVCDYNTIGKTNFTVGGDSTQDEMCLAFIVYYPKIPINKCETFPLPQNLYRYFGVNNFTITKQTDIRGTLKNVKVYQPDLPPTLDELVNQMEWNQTSADALSDFTQHLPRSQVCKSVVPLPSIVRIVDAPLIAKPYQAPVPQCNSSSATALRNSLLLVLITTLIVKTNILQA